MSGKPQILRYRTDETVWVPKHANGNIDVIFCSNPKYKNLYWEWGVVPNVIQMREGIKTCFSEYYISRFMKEIDNIHLIDFPFIVIFSSAKRPF